MPSTTRIIRPESEEPNTETGVSKEVQIIGDLEQNGFSIKKEELVSLLARLTQKDEKEIYVDNDLYEKLSSLLEREQALLPIKTQLIELEISRFVVDEDKFDSEEHDYCDKDIYCNNSHVAKTRLFQPELGFEYSYMPIEVFKRILAKLGNPYASYAYINETDLYVDFRLWALENNYSYEITNSYVNIKST